MIKEINAIKNLMHRHKLCEEECYCTTETTPNWTAIF